MSLSLLLLLLPFDLLVAPSTAEVATSTVIVSAPVSTSTSYTSVDEFRDAMLSRHNLYRDQHNASALDWNNSLAEFGEQWANRCTWEHSGGPSGENLAMGYINATVVVDAWGNERDQFNFARPDFSKETGHFTQMVWKDTRTVGCGRGDCDGRGSIAGW
ncbi:MAG: hypothetical protein M1837_001286 [Sclerophora amabilis]|nr:MAG: hypothetical protein M1837_001286 [Sclerophora amabilis]